MRVSFKRRGREDEDGGGGDARATYESRLDRVAMVMLVGDWCARKVERSRPKNRG